MGEEEVIRNRKCAERATQFKIITDIVFTQQLQKLTFLLFFWVGKHIKCPINVELKFPLGPLPGAGFVFGKKHELLYLENSIYLHMKQGHLE